MAIQVDEFVRDDLLGNAIFSGISKSIEGESTLEPTVSFNVEIPLKRSLLTDISSGEEGEGDIEN